MGKAEFSIDPEPEYLISIIGKDYEPFIKPNCIGGETYSVDLHALPRGVKIIKMGAGGRFKIPKFSEITVFGSVGNSPNITGVYLRSNSPDIIIPGTTPYPNQILVEVDTWFTITERSKRAEVKVLAPDGSTRYVLYRKLP